MQYLLFTHIIAGSISLIAAVLAVLSSKGKKLHILSGRTYFWGMAIIFLTAIPMSIINANIFLFLVAIFSFYLAYAGMRFARNRKGIANFFDWVAIGLMVLSGVIMFFLGTNYFINNNSWRDFANWLAQCTCNCIGSCFGIFRRNKYFWWISRNQAHASHVPKIIGIIG